MLRVPIDALRPWLRNIIYRYRRNIETADDWIRLHERQMVNGMKARGAETERPESLRPKYIRIWLKQDYKYLKSLATHWSIAVGRAHCRMNWLYDPEEVFGDLWRQKTAEFSPSESPDE